MSYAQRRSQYKNKADNTLSQSVESLQNISKFQPNRSTAGLGSDLAKLREARKAERQQEVEITRESREEMLFGDLNEIQQNRSTLQPDSRNRTFNRLAFSKEENRETDDFSAFVEQQQESILEEDYDVDIEEHEEDVPPKTVHVFNHDIVNQIEDDEEEIEDVRHSLLATDSNLEIIKEAEDILGGSPVLDQEEQKYEVAAPQSEEYHSEEEIPKHEEHYSDEIPQHEENHSEDEIPKFDEENPDLTPTQHEILHHEAVVPMNKQISDSENLPEFETEGSASPVKQMKSKLPEKKPIGLLSLRELRQANKAENKHAQLEARSKIEELEIQKQDSQRIPKALQRLKKDPEIITFSSYSTSEIGTKPTFSSKLKKPESKLTKLKTKVEKPESKMKAPSGGKFGLKGPTTPKTTGLKRPSVARAGKFTTQKAPIARSKTKKETDLASAEVEKAAKEAKEREKKELEAKRKEEAENRERKRKMMTERKLLLKKKLSAIKIQKFWKSRRRRRQRKLQHVRYQAAVRTLQRFFKNAMETKKANKAILEE